MKKLLFILFFAATAVVNADVTYAAYAYDGVLNDADGNDLMDGTYVLVVDVDADGYDYDSISADSWVFDDDDVILDMDSVSDGDAYPFWRAYTSDLWDDYDSTSDVYLFWFDVVYDEDSTGAGEDVSFGVELLSDIGADPGTYTSIVTGGDAIYQTIPEPATMSLLAIAGLGAFFNRRRLFNK